MNIRTASYWISTSLLAAGFVFGAVMDLSKAAPVMESMQHLGYPAYVATLLGMWKLLGTAAVLAPRLPRLKEWAYAGMFFDLSGAVVSHAAVGDGPDKLTPPLVFLALLVTSWYLRPESRVLGGSLLQGAKQAQPRLAHAA